MDIKTIATGSKGNAYRIITEGVVILLEAGIRWSQITVGLEYKIPTVCVITHEHGDHARAVLDVARRGILIICTHGTAVAVGLKPYEYATRYNDMGVQITLTAAVHAAAEPAIIIIDNNKRERLVFATDTRKIPVNIDGITQLMIEANYSKYTERDDNTHKQATAEHLSLEDAIAWIEMQNIERLREIRAIHLSDSNSDEDYTKQKLQKFGVPVYIERGQNEKF